MLYQIQIIYSSINEFYNADAIAV